MADYSVDTVRFVAKYMENIDKNIGARNVLAAKQLALIKKENEKRTKLGKPAEQPPKDLVSDNYELFDYDIFWAVISAKSSSGLDLGVRNIAIDCLIASVSKSALLIENYLSRAIYAITSGADCELQAMDFFRLSLMATKERQSIRSALRIVNKDYHLMDAVFKHFTDYMAQSYVAASAVAPDPIISHVLNPRLISGGRSLGHYTHTSNA